MRQESLKERFMRQMKEGQQGRRKNFCQLCQRHCRDRNAMKCHLNSGRHKKQVVLFEKNALEMVAKRTEKFEKNFVMILEEIYPKQSVRSKQVHQNYSKEVRNVSIFSTQWGTLENFINDLGQQGKLKVTYKGGEQFIELLDISNQAKLLKRMKLKFKRKQEKYRLKKERKIRESLAIAERLSQINNKKDQQVDHSTHKDFEPGEFKFTLKPKVKKEILPAPKIIKFEKPNVIQKIIEIDGEKFPVPMKPIAFKGNDYKSQTTSKTVLKKREKTGFDLLAEEFQRRQKKKLIKQFKDQKEEVKEEKIDLQNTPWILPGIIVKIKDKQVQNGELYKKKARVIEVIDDFLGKIEVLSKRNPFKLKIDQNFLQTVIPKKGKKVMVLKPGPFRGKTGILESIHADNYSGSIKLLDEDTALELPYELFSKVYNK